MYKIGTRGSKLALAQTNEVIDRLVNANHELTHNDFEIVVIVTMGDRITDRALIEIGGKSLFIKEIEDALLKEEVDFAVHSMKDMTAFIPEDLVIASILPREDVRDAFLSTKCKSLYELPHGATIGTSSSRRKAQALKYRPDLNIVVFRGNVNTRMRKLEEGEVDATFLAMAGLNRLNIDKALYNPIETDIMLPAVAQGAIGLETRKNDQKIIELLRTINCRESEIRVNCERGVLEALEADCKTPIAALAQIKDNHIFLKAELIIEGSIHALQGSDSIENAYKLGWKIGQNLKGYIV